MRRPPVGALKSREEKQTLILLSLPLPSGRPFLDPTPAPYAEVPGPGPRTDRVARTIQCPRCPRKLPVDLATWSPRPGDLPARVLLDVPALRLTWSDPRPRDRAARTGQQGPAWLAPFVRNTSLARPGQAISHSGTAQTASRAALFLAPLCLASPRPCWTSSSRGKASGKRTVLSCPGPSRHRPFSLGRPQHALLPPGSAEGNGGLTPFLSVERLLAASAGARHLTCTPRWS